MAGELYRAEFEYWDNGETKKTTIETELEYIIVEFDEEGRLLRATKKAKVEHLPLADNEN